MKRLALTLALLAPLLASLPPEPARGTPADSDGRATVTVTLVTGDRVTVTRAADATPRVSVVPARKPGRVTTFHTTMVNGSVRVVPGDVARLVPGVLDPRLFDVMALAEVSTQDSIPLIVQGPAGTRWRSGKQLPSINAVAVGLSAGEAMALTGEAAVARSGVERIWLDSRVHADHLQNPKPKWDTNLDQIGAPAAWAAGLSGAGVTVAVLDTGVDATHPDLAGRVALAQNFTSGPDAVDRNGHGTHVASLLAGSGAASGSAASGSAASGGAEGDAAGGGAEGDAAGGGVAGGGVDRRGARRGVAFGSTLLVGKVLDDDGAGSFSDIIAGMEWAAARARIVNMSLGSDFPSAGNDPLSLAVQSLTQAHGTLFVASAGNRGPAGGSVGSPGAAPAALTVGAVDLRDRLADFSSRGPRPGDYGMKPDLVAPGVDIIAARAAGTELGDPVGERYTRLSGTSMAAPQAAGAAALMAQLHPQWTGSDLKALLMGSATAVGGAFEAGAGRVDLAAALPQTVIATQPSAAFGFAAYPQAGLPPVSAQVSLANKGSRPVTLDLATQGVNFSVTPSRVSLPAGGQAAVTVTAAVDVGGFGPVSGALVAGRKVRIPLGVVREEVHHHLKIRAVDRLGASEQIETLAWLVNLQDATKSPPDPVLLTGGEGTVRLRPGVYTVTAAIPTIEEGEPDPGGDVPVVTSISIATKAEVTVAADGEVVLDARQARPLTATVAGRQTVPVDVQVFVAAKDRAGNSSVLSYATSAQDVIEGKLFIEPTTPARHGDLELSSKWRLDTVGGGPTYDLQFADRVFPASLDYVVDPRSLAQVQTTYRVPDSPAEYVEGRFVHTPLTPVSVAILQPGPAAPAQRVEWLSPGTKAEWFQCANVLVAQEGIGGYCQAPAGYRRAQSVQRDWLRAPLRTRAAVSFSRTRLFVGMDELADDAGNAGSLASYVFPERSFSLYRNDVLIAQGPDALGGHRIAPGPAAYRLTRSLVLRPGLIGLSTEVNTSWTFFTPPEKQTEAALVEVAVHAPVDANNHVPAGSAMTVEVTHPGGRLAGVQLQLSTDDGKTWHTMGLRPAGAGRFRVELAAVTGVVSLRTKASDTSGAATEQTVVRAFVVDPPG
ncbi:S8 family serine peptidase [Rhizocola hellebori]|nr:S8 family serine peptidase [Rhizocola hellebori]